LKSVFASDRDGRMVCMVQFLDYGGTPGSPVKRAISMKLREVGQPDGLGACRLGPGWGPKPGKNGCASKQIGVTVQADHPARVRTIHHFPSSETWPSHVPPGEGASGSLALF